MSVEPLPVDGEEDVHLDLSGLGFIDAAGTRMLVQAAERLERRPLALNGWTRK